MPTLDLSFLADEGLIAGEPFQVVRRTKSIDPSTGAVAYSSTTLDARGGISPEGGDLERGPEYQVEPSSISVVTRFRLQGPSPGREADLVMWPLGSPDAYLVDRVQDWTSYGAGFVQAHASSTDLLDQPPAAEGS